MYILADDNIFVKLILNIKNEYDELKGPFRDLQPHHASPPFSPKKLRFLHQQKPLGIHKICVQTISCK